MSISLKGGWSYCDEQILQITPHLEKNKEIKILELGSGDSTLKLYNYYTTLYDSVIFHTCENNRHYLCNHEDIHSHLYASVADFTLPEEVFDLILVDGPFGESRKDWYSKLGKTSRVGTIIHIDDVYHFDSFVQELDKYFEYETLHDFGKGQHNCWRTVRLTKIL